MESIDKIKTRVVGVDIREAKTTYAVVDIRGDIVTQDYFLTQDYPWMCFLPRYRKSFLTSQLRTIFL